MTEDNVNNKTITQSPATVSFATLGCKTNHFETAAMQQSLSQAGYKVLRFDQGADLVIVNTCTVTQATDAQSRNLIRKARRLNPFCRVVVTGCYAQVNPEMSLTLPGVSLVVGNDEKQKLLHYLHQETENSQIAVSEKPHESTVCLQPLTSFSGRSRAFVQIQNGCDAFCSYCIIPYARGSSRSASPPVILRQVNTLVEAGFKEVVLTGIHIGNYGRDLMPDSTLAQLIKRIESETDLYRLRLGSIEPNEFSEDLLQTISSSKIVCPHFHIPLQAGDDDVLHRMGRGYTASFFKELIRTLSKKVLNPYICVDVIAGFPGETDLEFQNTYDFIAELPITDLHVFPFSKRPGTPAAKMACQIPDSRKKIRAKKLRELAARKHADYAKSHIGKNLEIIVESNKKEGIFKGVSRNYLDVRFSSGTPLSGQCTMVSITGWKDGMLFGKKL